MIMKLQTTYKPKDYYELIKDEVPLSLGVLRLICNNFEKLNKNSKKKLMQRLGIIRMLEQNKKNYQEKINKDEKIRFKKEVEIIEIFQRNNI